LIGGGKPGAVEASFSERSDGFKDHVRDPEACAQISAKATPHRIRVTAIMLRCISRPMPHQFEERAAQLGAGDALMHPVATGRGVVSDRSDHRRAACGAGA